MKVKLAYGREGLEVELPTDRTTVIESEFLTGLRDEEDAIVRALEDPTAGPPLKSRIQPSSRVAISLCDVTRAMPTRRILPIILKHLGGILPRQVSLLIATGTHRANSEAELRQMLGAEVVENYVAYNHDCFDRAQLEHLGETRRGIPVWLNRRWLEADVRITLGFVEPHFFAGFSGGPKMVAPGLAGFDTILGLHSAELIGDPQSVWGVIDQNPIHESIREIALMSEVAFGLDVTLNRECRITGVYAGDLLRSHRAACRQAHRTAMRPFSGPFDIVLTSNSGYPLDLNLYQAVKGMSAAARVVRKGGTIICAAECSDGVPSHGEYGKILRSADNPAELLEMISSPGYAHQDQWQVQIQAQIQQKADVYVKCDGVSPQQLREAHFEPVDDVEALIHDKLDQHGPKSRLCVLPEGPQTIPYLSMAGTESSKRG